MTTPSTAQGEGSEKLTDRFKISDMLQHGWKARSEVVVWLDSRDVVAHGKIERHDKLLDGEFILALDDHKSSRELLASQRRNPQQVHHVLFMLGPKGMLGVRTIPLRWAEDRFWYPNPETAISYQRRDSPRYAVPKGYEIWCRFHHPKDGGQKTPRRLIDLSDGGMSILVPAGEEAQIPVGTPLLNGEIVLMGRLLRYEAKVVNGRAYQGDLLGPDEEPYVRVGVEFVRVSNEDRRFLKDYVLSQTLRFLK